MEFSKILDNEFLFVPVSIWLLIQLWKFIYSLIKYKKLDLKRLLGAGGMPSAHSAVVSSLATVIGRYQGFDSPIFALSVIFAFIVMYDAAGVRRAAGKQARVLNKIINSDKIENINIQEKLVELLGHTPFEVFIGLLIGIGYALLF